jgi:hypothetical protein
LTTPRFSGRAPHAAMAVLSSGYRPLAPCPAQRLERSDFVHWHSSDALVRNAKVRQLAFSGRACYDTNRRE